MAKNVILKGDSLPILLSHFGALNKRLLANWNRNLFIYLQIYANTVTIDVLDQKPVTLNKKIK